MSLYTAEHAQGQDARLMPRIFDNINESLLPALQSACRLRPCDFVSVISIFVIITHDYVEVAAARNCCRLLVGMQALPEEDSALP